MNSNSIIEREKDFIEEICNKYNYDDNISHLLYLMIPAFIIKYGSSKEKLIQDTFRNIRIISSNKENSIVKAYYSSIPKIINNEIKTTKCMVIQNYNKIGLVDLLDNLVHEFNHAINSYLNEVRETSNYIYLRTGLTYRIYDKDLKFIKKDPSYILEEIINTKQTSDIINIIKDFDSTNNTIYALNAETSNKYNSNSYYLQSYVCREILNNRTFYNTLEKLRLTGEIYDIAPWFDDISGKKGTYKELINSLNEIYDLELKYTKRKLFKSILIGKIKDESRKIMRIIDKFNNNVNFK